MVGIYFGLVVLVISTPALLWGFLPARESTLELEIPNAALTTLLWTPAIRSEDEGWIRLTVSGFEYSQFQEGTIPESSETSPAAVPSAAIPVVEARLELAGMRINPGVSMSQPLPPDKPIWFQWQISPARTGDFTGSVWLYLNQIPGNGGEWSRQPLSIQPIAIETSEFVGMNGSQARSIGAVGGFVGLGVTVGLWLKKDRMRFI
jgi:hypothetical protein